MSSHDTDSVLKTTPAALELKAVEAGYGDTRVLWDVSLSVESASVVALLGANGAGKSTTLKVAAGLLRPTMGSILLDGKDITRTKAHDRAGAGLCLIPEGRGIFRSLSVKDNLELQIPLGRKVDIEPALNAFPILGERLKQIAGSMSGGQQQMLALARAFLSNPRVVLLDELSMGLAPILVDEIFESFRKIAAEGVSLLIVEQYVGQALELADQVYLMASGRVAWSGAASGLDEDALRAMYLGGANEIEV